MKYDKNAPAHRYWVQVGGDRRIGPYAIHRKVNRDDVEVVNCVSDEDDTVKRWVIVIDGEHEAWVKVAEKDAYGYDIQPGERVSEAELEAITLKHAAIRDGTSVSVGEARTLLKSGDPEQLPHALIALYYAAKADPDITEHELDTLRETVHEHTNHVDTSHTPTVKRILDEVRSPTE